MNMEIQDFFKSLYNDLEHAKNTKTLKLLRKYARKRVAKDLSIDNISITYKKELQTSYKRFVKALKLAQKKLK